MSKCSCDGPMDYVRVSDEGLYHQYDGPDARLRCTECGGKAGFIPVDALEAFGFSEEDVAKSTDPGPPEIYLTVTAEWDEPTPAGEL